MNPLKEMQKVMNGMKRELIKFDEMKKEHVKLIEASCKIENSFNAMSDSVSEFCSTCPEKDEAMCGNCYLNKWLD